MRYFIFGVLFVFSNTMTLSYFKINKSKHIATYYAQVIFNLLVVTGVIFL